MTIRNYMAEMRYIFAYYNHLNPEQLTQEHIAAETGIALPSEWCSHCHMNSIR